MCIPDQGCVNTPLKCKTTSPATSCIEWYCNATTDTVCTSRAFNPIPPQCTNATVPECEVVGDCNDRTNCTTDACVAGKCVYTSISCPASTKCSLTTCKPTIGCFTTNLTTCSDDNECTDDSCDPLIGCVHKNITCPSSTDPCLYSFCDKQNGCVTSPIGCTQLTAENCTVPACNETCYLKYICYTPPPSGEENAPPTTLILASTLTTAAVAGIVCGAVILAVGVGGGAAVAVAGGAGAGGVTAVFSNPVYAGTAMSGQNPLSQDG
jgi:hypothetical protein